MDLLYTAAIAWSQLLTFRYDIICGKSKKLYPISLDFKEDEFYHLAGFPHIKDIVFPTQFPQSAMLRKVLDGTITEQMISKSEGYEKTVKVIYTVDDWSTQGSYELEYEKTLENGDEKNA